MQNSIKTKNFKANGVIIALLTALMAIAVIFGGAGVMNASAKRLPFVHFSATINLIYNTGYVESVDVTVESYTEENSSSTYTIFTLPSPLKEIITDMSCGDTQGTSYSNGVFRFPGTISTVAFNASYLNYNVVTASSAFPETPTKEGYTFKGWYFDEAFTQAYDGRPITSDTKLYAKFEINRYTVTFDSAGGSTVSSQTVDWNTVLSLPNTSRAGYDFLGWYYSNGTQYTNQVITANTSLVARWEIKHFAVSFDSAGGAAVETQTVDYGNSASVSSISREGYNFLGWFLSNGTQYTNQAITENTTLTAKWQIKTFKVTYDSNGGEAVSEETIEWNKTASAPTLERTGYIFHGWYNGETKYEGQAVTADMTLTAKWEVIKYTVTFYVDGEVYETMEVAYGTTFQEAMAANERLFFMNLLNDEGVKISKSAKVTGDVSVPVGEMTNEEKVAAFIGNNLWVLYLAGGLILAGIAATVIASVVAHKRR